VLPHLLALKLGCLVCVPVSGLLCWRDLCVAPRLFDVIAVGLRDMVRAVESREQDGGRDHPSGHPGPASRHFCPSHIFK